MKDLETVNRLRSCHLNAPAEDYVRRCVELAQLNSEKATRRKEILNSLISSGISPVKMEDGGCSVMECRCGGWFCYYCGDRPYDPRSISQKHGDEPPDYMKFVKGDNVIDEELEKFDEKYPTWRPEESLNNVCSI